MTNLRSHGSLKDLYLFCMKFIANKLGRLLILGRIFITQTLKSLPTSCFPDCWNVSLVIPVFKNVVERSTAKTFTLLVFEKPVNNGIVNHLEKCGLFLISSVVSCLLDQLQIFLQLYLNELLGLLAGLGLIEL